MTSEPAANLYRTVAATLAALLLLAAGFALGRVSAPGTDLDYLTAVDRVRAAEQAACVKTFEDALNMFKNTSTQAFAQLRAEREARDTSMRTAHDEDLKVMRLAIVGCESTKVSH